MIFLVDHPNLGLRNSYTSEALAKVNFYRPRYEKTVDVIDERGLKGPAHLFTIDGALFNGECIMVPAQTKKGGRVSANAAESLAEQFIRDTVKAARQAHEEDVIDSFTDASVEGRKNYSDGFKPEQLVKLERIIEDKVGNRPA